MSALKAAVARVAELAGVDASLDEGFAIARAAVETLNAALLSQARVNVARAEYRRLTGHAATTLVDDPAHQAVAVFGAGGLLIVKVIDDSVEVLASFALDGAEAVAPTVEPAPADDGARAAMLAKHASLINGTCGLDEGARPRRRRPRREID